MFEGKNAKKVLRVCIRNLSAPYQLPIRSLSEWRATDRRGECVASGYNPRESGWKVLRDGVWCGRDVGDCAARHHTRFAILSELRDRGSPVGLLG